MANQMRVRPSESPSWAVADLAERLEVGAPEGAADIRFTGIALNSSQVESGDLYAALPGARAHGADYAPTAIEAGAVAILTDAEGA
ncbi:MAG: Mur ligase domain-containing protein, partial [Aeromicrobium sp.]